MSRKRFFWDSTCHLQCHKVIEIILKSEIGPLKFKIQKKKKTLTIVPNTALGIINIYEFYDS